jgi:Ni,Fe-hydrogenase I large subunit
VVFDADLESVAKISSIEALNQYRDADQWNKGDFRAFLHISEQQHLDQLGRATDRFMSFGHSPLHGKTHFRRGVSGLNGEVESLNLFEISEYLSHSWMARRTCEPGALEQALENTPVLASEKEPVNVQHIVRSFDPCMAWSVRCIRCNYQFFTCKSAAPNPIKIPPVTR